MWAAFITGLLGSTHCVGMCGPIALALPLSGLQRREMALHLLAYNAGRVTTYSIFGAVVGMLGRGIVLAGFQQFLAIATGFSLLLVVFFSFAKEREYLSSFPFFDRLLALVKKSIGRFIIQHGISSVYMVGMLNGFIPCGLVYFGIAGALLTGSAFHGALYMFIFGVGTVPLMLAAVLAGNLAGAAWRKKIRRFMPYLMLLIAFLLIYRAMHVNPEAILSGVPGADAQCH